MIDDVLRSLLTTAGPSGSEGAAAAVFRDACVAVGAEAATDHVGSTVARLPGAADGLSVAVIGHIDEIGLTISHIDDQGHLWFVGVGGWDPLILLGQRVEILARDGVIGGVVGRKPIHLLEDDDRKRVPKLRELHIDIGARDGDDARSAVRVGDVAVIAAEPVELRNGRLASRSMDNRLGCWVAYETLRLLAEGERPAGDAYAVAAAHEETTMQGAITTTYALQPDVAVVVDVTHATDVPGVDERAVGRHPTGSGVVIERGAMLNPRVAELLLDAAEAEGIPHTIEASGRYTGTDADAVVHSRAGVPTGVLGIPLRYMHSPVELVDPEDVRAAARLCAAFIRRLDPGQSFLR